MHLRQPGLAYSTCGPFTKNEESIKKIKETRDSRYIYQNELNKACFQYGMAYGDFKDLTRRTSSDKFLREKAFNITKNPKYDGYQGGLASMVCKFLIEKLLAMVLKIKTCQTSNSQKNYAKQSLKNLRKVRHIHLL